MNLEWPSIITIILGSSVVGTALNIFINWKLKNSDKSAKATYLALSLAHLFENYAYDCLTLAEDHGNAKSSNNFAGNYISTIPKFPELPQSDYLVLAPNILDTVFDFPQQVRFSSDYFSSAVEFIGGEDAADEGYKSVLELSLKSLNIANTLRKNYKLRKRSLKFKNYSIRDEISNRLKNL